ncbi:MAG: hypothetical protein MZV64_29610 [Ignavibacteriales bacterium]|nr:hypothetical protein [Ignavibacteriales bacterium]
MTMSSPPETPPAAAPLFPAVREGIARDQEAQLGTDTLIHHGAGETWTGPERFAGSPPPYTAVEVQSLWQTQQTIASIIAQNLRDTASGVDSPRDRWTPASDSPMCSWIPPGGSSTTISTGRDLHDGLTANGILSTESLDGELMISRSSRDRSRLLTPFGPAEREGGNVVTWLTGPFVYVLRGPTGRMLVP